MGQDLGLRREKIVWRAMGFFLGILERVFLCEKNYTFKKTAKSQLKAHHILFLSFFLFSILIYFFLHSHRLPLYTIESNLHSLYR